MTLCTACANESEYNAFPGEYLGYCNYRLLQRIASERPPDLRPSFQQGSFQQASYLGLRLLYLESVVRLPRLTSGLQPCRYCIRWTGSTLNAQTFENGSGGYSRLGALVVRAVGSLSLSLSVGRTSLTITVRTRLLLQGNCESLKCLQVYAVAESSELVWKYQMLEGTFSGWNRGYLKDLESFVGVALTPRLNNGRLFFCATNLWKISDTLTDNITRYPGSPLLHTDRDLIPQGN
ncbi:hypothetical protein BZA77DRAFT_292198 [Pyronema omphalodes]|nr:hypothetical protein BZA77DRAFT_292198 [Pyronema omphalodes]